MTRSSVVWTGLLGLFGGVLLTLLCAAVMIQGWIPVLISRPLFVWALFLFLVTLSVLEIPVMVFSMRRMADSPNPRAKYVVQVTNVAYVSFAAVYAAPFLLLTGASQLEIAAGLFLGSLCFVRFISSVVFLPNAKK